MAESKFVIALRLRSSGPLAYNLQLSFGNGVGTDAGAREMWASAHRFMSWRSRRSRAWEIHRKRGFEDSGNWDETMFNVFRLDQGTVRHFWGSELTWVDLDPAMDHRSGDAVNALWGLLDMTPEGREQFMPKLAY